MRPNLQYPISKTLSEPFRILQGAFADSLKTFTSPALPLLEAVLFLPQLNCLSTRLLLR